jgi:hypothetical protein
VYEGGWSDGTWNGYGKLTFNAPHPNAGESTLGQFSGGFINGVAVANLKDDAGMMKRLGEFRNSQRDGYSITRFADGGSIASYFIGGKISGPTSHHFRSGGRYEGELNQQGRYDGAGVEWNSAGRVLRAGRWRDGALSQPLAAVPGQTGARPASASQPAPSSTPAPASAPAASLGPAPRIGGLPLEASLEAAYLAARARLPAELRPPSPRPGPARADFLPADPARSTYYHRCVAGFRLLQDEARRTGQSQSLLGTMTSAKELGDYSNQHMVAGMFRAADPMGGGGATDEAIAGYRRDLQTRFIGTPSLLRDFAGVCFIAGADDALAASDKFRRLTSGK